jgi:hypothetical protein
MMRVGRDPLRVSPSAQREQDDAAAASGRSISQCKRQASAATYDRQGMIVPATIG